MPSYFYHIALELFAHSRPDPDSAYQASDASNTTSLSFDSACEALLPFQKRPHHVASSRSARPPSFDQTQCPPPTTFCSPSRSSSGSDTPSTSTRTTPPLYSRSTISTPEAGQDLRLDEVSIQCIDMVAPEQDQTAARRASKRDHASDNPVATGIGADILGGLRTRGRYIPLDQQTSDSVWGIVHLYRDAREAPYLAVDEYPPDLKGSAAARRPSDELGRGESKAARQGGLADTSIQPTGQPDEDCTTLCILAVPSYLSPSDFLGFVGEATLDDVSHFRMIRTARANRYMVLMKFRSGKKAGEWQRTWNGKVFNSMEVSDFIALDSGSDRKS